MSWLSFLQPLCDRAKIDKLLFKKYRNLSPAKKNVLLVLKTRSFPHVAKFTVAIVFIHVTDSLSWWAKHDSIVNNGVNAV